MTDPSERLTPASAEDSPTRSRSPCNSKAGKRVHNADEIMTEIVARRLVDHLDRAGFVVMKRPAEIGTAALGRGFEGP